MRKLLVLMFYALAVISTSYAQDKYWIFFKDKEGIAEAKQYVSDLTIRNRMAMGLAVDQYTDRQVSKKHTDILKALGIKVVSTSRWLNAVAARLDAIQFQLVRGLDFVVSLSKVQGMQYALTAGRPMDVENIAFEQISTRSFEKEKLTGKGVVIGVIDGSFEHADGNVTISQLFKDGNVLGTRNFLDQDQHSFFSSFTNEDGHGSMVLQMISGYDKAGKRKFGFATQASFYLASTDHSEQEVRKEEDYWIAALEWMDSLGVRLVHSSLGYSQDYDDPNENYKPAQMDGKTSAISRAAQIAAESKGMVIVVSAGNEGANSSWRVISAPADAKNVISVGATDPYLLKANVSSTGPEFLSYVKPDISCFSAHGTSLSAPVITGLIACMMQWDSKLSNVQVRKLIESSGHLFPYCNNYLGFGVPNADKIIRMLKDPASLTMSPSEEMRCKERICEIKIKKTTSPVTVFHKSGEWVVRQQDILLAADDRVVVDRFGQASRSTVFVDQRVIEIVWED